MYGAAPGAHTPTPDTMIKRKYKLGKVQKDKEICLRMVFQWMGEFERIDREEKKGMMIRNLQADIEKFLMVFDDTYNLTLMEFLKFVEDAASKSRVYSPITVHGDLDAGGWRSLDEESCLEGGREPFIRFDRKWRTP